MWNHKKLAFTRLILETLERCKKSIDYHEKWFLLLAQRLSSKQVVALIARKIENNRKKMFFRKENGSINFHKQKAAWMKMFPLCLLGKRYRLWWLFRRYYFYTKLPKAAKLETKRQKTFSSLPQLKILVLHNKFLFPWRKIFYFHWRFNCASWVQHRRNFIAIKEIFTSDITRLSNIKIYFYANRSKCKKTV